jgi:fluoride exporter
MNLIWVFIGGGLGSVVRYLLGLVFAKSNLSLPIATLSANIISCSIFAFSLWAFHQKLQENQGLKLFILTGICGGLSTFSAFSYETMELLKQQNYLWASANIILSLVLCILIFYTFIGKLS